MAKIPLKNKKRLVVAFTIFCALLFFLCIRVGYVQIVKGEEYSKEAMKQQTKDEIVQPKRGDILDRNGNQLAVSTMRYSVWVRPALVKDGSKDGEGKAKITKVSTDLAAILELDPAEVEKTLSQEISLIKVAKYLERDKADGVRAYVKENKVEGISITEETKRYYPLSNFSSQLLGSVTDDNNGLSGMELYYNKYLKGVPGRWIQNKDASGKSLSYGVSKNHKQEDGSTVVLTIDLVIQNYAEQSVADAKVQFKADRVSCIVMDPKTGEILAVASTPGFDPNNSRTPVDPKDAETLKSMDEKDQLDYLNKMWRNPLFSDTYVPGSTMKLITTAMALEEGLTSLDEHFYCSGSINVSGVNLKCLRYQQPHGDENLIEAVGNSCNPVFVQLAQRIGIEKFYDYLSLFGITQQTGVDFPGEGSSQLQDKATAGPVGLSTMGFGQGMAVTPIQLLTAISSFGNEGMLMQPHLVKEIKNANGKVIQTFEPVQVRQTVSKETAEQIKNIMEYVVEKGGSSNAKVPGYRVGGKTGTSNVESEGNKIIASFVGIAPLDDPQLAILFIVENPAGEIYGSTVAAPGAQVVLEKSLRYLKIKSDGQGEVK